MAPTPHGSTLVSDDDLVLPKGFRPYTPPGAAAIKIPSRILPFRPVLEHHHQTKDTFDRFFARTRQEAQAKQIDLEEQAIPPMARATEQVEPSFPDQPLETTQPADSAGRVVEGVLYIHDDGTIQYLNLEPHPRREGVCYALDADDQRLLASDRKGEVLTDSDGFALPPKNTWINRVKNAVVNPDGGNTDNYNPVIAYDKNGVPLERFDVVAPGRAPTDGMGERKNRAGKILLVAGSVLAVTGGLIGLVLGSSRVPAEGQITAEEAENYNLTQYPVGPASTFGAHYLELCLTHPQYKEDIEDRNERMAGMEAAGVPPYCGWESGGAATAPSSVVFTGNVEERPEYNTNGGEVAYLDYAVTMQDGGSFTATVPVWATVDDNNRMAFSIVGSVGMTASTALDMSPNMELAAPVDRELANVLNPTLNTFFTAWAASDSEALAAILHNDATGEATVGLDGSVSSPDITSVVVYPSKAPEEVSGDRATFEYEEGDEVTAMVNLTWNVNDSVGGYDQPTGYRVTLVYDGGKWEVTALDNGVVVPGTGSSSGDGSSSTAGDNPTGNLGGGVSGGFGSADTGEGESPAGEDDTDGGGSDSGENGDGEGSEGGSNITGFTDTGGGD